MTELLYNYLSYKFFRDKFIELIHPQLGEVSWEQCSTQEDLGEYGIPDMSITEPDQFDIRIEVKVQDSGLTSNQPFRYIEYLNKSKVKTKGLIFLCPKKYAHLEEWKTGLSDDPQLHQDILYWDDIINLIEENEFHIQNPLFSEFYNLLCSWFRPLEITFEHSKIKRMFTNEIPKIILQLFEVVHQVEEQVLKEGYSVSRNKNSNEYAITIKNNDQDYHDSLVFFGVWYDFWKAHKKPLCYAIKDIPANKKKIDILAAYMMKQGKETLDYEGWKVSYVTEETIHESNSTELIASETLELVKQLEPSQ